MYVVYIIIRAYVVMTLFDMNPEIGRLYIFIV
jgi:hypothetical protein